MLDIHGKFHGRMIWKVNFLSGLAKLVKQDENMIVMNGGDCTPEMGRQDCRRM